MNYDIRPYAGVGRIDFGMRREDIRQLLASAFKSAGEDSGEIPADFFTQLGMIIYYKPPGLCHAVDFTGPVSPTFEGHPIRKQPCGKIRHWIETLDPGIIPDDAGFRSRKLGFGIFASAGMKEPESSVDSVIVFDHGYYDWERELEALNLE